ncbi:MAG: hypothetical protein M5U09_03450 [Gammaproteobacteria bacterium]|nr:hypothetical protein [Gammaproteobacteria bacterium]
MSAWSAPGDAFLATEVVVDRADADGGIGLDVVHGGVEISARREKVQCGAEDVVADGPRFRGRLDIHR